MVEFYAREKEKERRNSEQTFGKGRCAAVGFLKVLLFSFFSCPLKKEDEPTAEPAPNAYKFTEGKR